MAGLDPAIHAFLNQSPETALLFCKKAVRRVGCPIARHLLSVMAGLDPAIHAFLNQSPKTALLFCKKAVRSS
jgi:hypothetical protein